MKNKTAKPTALLHFQVLGMYQLCYIVNVISISSIKNIKNVNIFNINNNETCKTEGSVTLPHVDQVA